MTTNRPNPVDGDVQALIEHIKAVIDEYESFGAGGMDEQVYRIAFAELTAEPCAFLYGASFERGEVEGEIEDSPGTDMPVFTTPPAQLLRPVELPEFKVHSNQPCWPPLTVGLRDKEWIEALRQQGYEVKSND